MKNGMCPHRIPGGAWCRECNPSKGASMSERYRSPVNVDHRLREAASIARSHGEDGLAECLEEMASDPRPESEIERAARGYRDACEAWRTDPCLKTHDAMCKAWLGLIRAVESNEPPKGVWLSEEEAERLMRRCDEGIEHVNAARPEGGLQVSPSRYDRARIELERIRQAIRARLEASRGS